VIEQTDQRHLEQPEKSEKRARPALERSSYVGWPRGEHAPSLSLLGKKKSLAEARLAKPDHS
jgi:hypothetical protein